jgi:hypothetical protein
MKICKVLANGMMTVAAMTLLAASAGASNVDWDVHVGSGDGGVHTPAPVIVQPQPVYIKHPNGHRKCNKHHKCKWKKHKYHGG